MAEEQDPAEIQAIKIGSLFGIFGISVIASVAPWFIKKRAKNADFILSLLNALAGGVTLGAAFNHMLPAARESFAAWLPEDTFAWPETIAIGGVIILLSVDTIFLSSMEGGHSHDHGHSHGHDHSHDHSHYESSSHAAAANATVLNSPPSTKIEIMEKSKLVRSNSNNNETLYGTPNSSGLPMHTLAVSDLLSIESCQQDNSSSSNPAAPASINAEVVHPSPSLSAMDEPSNQIVPSLKITVPAQPQSYTAEGIISYDAIAAIMPASPMMADSAFATSTALASRAYLFVLALSVHSFLEGTGLGAETESEGILSVLAAILAHKGLEAFALGAAVHSGVFSTVKSMVIVMFYCLTTPAGIGLGMGLAQGLDGNGPAAVLVSLAAGSFIYISLLELIPRELSHRRGKLAKLGLIASGWAFMAGISKVA